MILDIPDKSRGVCTPPDLHSDHLSPHKKQEIRKTKKKKREKKKERDLTILVTGASSGIGLSLSRKLLLSGFHVIAACKDPSEVFPLAQDLKSYLLLHSSSEKGDSYHEEESSGGDNGEQGEGERPEERVEEEEEDRDDREDEEEEKDQRHVRMTNKESKDGIPRRREDVKGRKKKVISRSVEEEDEAQGRLQEIEDKLKVKKDSKVEEKETCELHACDKKQEGDQTAFSSKAERHDERILFSPGFRKVSASSSSRFFLSFECMYSRCLVVNMDITRSDQVQEAVKLTRLFLERTATKRKGEKKKKKRNAGLYAVIHCAGIWICDFAPSSSSFSAEKTFLKSPSPASASLQSIPSQLFSVNVYGALRVLLAFLPLLEIFNTSQQSPPRQRSYETLLHSRSVSSVEDLGPSPTIEGKKKQKTVGGKGPLKSFTGLRHLLLSLLKGFFLTRQIYSLLSYFFSVIGKTVFSRSSSFPFSSSPRLCNGRSRFILIGSILGRVRAEAMRGQRAYCASKAAVQVLSERYREKTKKKGVHIVLVEPGATQTNLFSQSLSALGSSSSSSFSSSSFLTSSPMKTPSSSSLLKGERGERISSLHHLLHEEQRHPSTSSLSFDISPSSSSVSTVTTDSTSLSSSVSSIVITSRSRHLQTPPCMGITGALDSPYREISNERNTQKEHEEEEEEEGERLFFFSNTLTFFRSSLLLLLSALRGNGEERNLCHSSIQMSRRERELQKTFVDQCNALLKFASHADDIADKIIAGAVCTLEPPSRYPVGWDTFVWMILSFFPLSLQRFFFELIFLNPIVHQLTKMAVHVSSLFSSRLRKAAEEESSSQF